MKVNDTNCPNCGAPIKGPKCEYCDTVFDQKAIDYEDIMYRIRIDELERQLRRAKISISNANQSAWLLQQMGTITCNAAADNIPYISLNSTSYLY